MDFPTQIYIDGELVDGSGSRDVFNPATEACIATVSTAGIEDAERALQAAKAALVLNVMASARPANFLSFIIKSSLE